MVDVLGDFIDTLATDAASIPPTPGSPASIATTKPASDDR
jgi:hypothetical protein